ncbi:MAG: hypothetical protein ACFFAU_16980 [Candidatus Hodarchaeota archaeon]
MVLSTRKKPIPLSKNIRASFSEHQYSVIFETIRGEEVLYPDQIDHLIGNLLELKETLIPQAYSNNQSYQKLLQNI